MILTLLMGLGALIVVLGYVAVDHAALAAAWGVILGIWVVAIRDEMAEHLGGRE